MGRGIHSYGRTYKSDQSLHVHLVALMKVNRASCFTFEARVEEVFGIFQRGSLGESHFYDVLVRLTSADQSIVRPHRNSPFPFFNDFGIGLLDESAEMQEHLASPVVKLLDFSIYQLRGGFFF